MYMGFMHDAFQIKLTSLACKKGMQTSNEKDLEQKRGVRTATKKTETSLRASSKAMNLLP